MGWHLVSTKRGEHERQALAEVAQDLEGGAARAQDHGRAQLGHRGPAQAQEFAHLVARSQVLGQGGLVVAQAREIDDPGQAGEPGGAGGVAGGPAVDGREVAGPGPHGVDQVEGRAAALHGPGERVLVQGVGGHGLQVGMTAPGPGPDFFQVAARGAHAPAAFQEQGHETAAHVARGPEHEHWSGRGFHVSLPGG